MSSSQTVSGRSHARKLITGIVCAELFRIGIVLALACIAVEGEKRFGNRVFLLFVPFAVFNLNTTWFSRKILEKASRHVKFERQEELSSTAGLLARTVSALGLCLVFLIGPFCLSTPWPLGIAIPLTILAFAGTVYSAYCLRLPMRMIDQAFSAS